MPKQKHRRLRVLLNLALISAGIFHGAYAGPLEPPVPPGEPTMTPIDRIDPRTPIYADMMPLTITERGSYYLTEDISTAGAGIKIQAHGVTLDLMGFTLAGETGPGIDGTNYDWITVRNGSIRDWAGTGINLGNWAVLSDLMVTYNRGSGIDVGVSSRVEDSTANHNWVHGIIAATGSLVRRCVASDNGENGIWSHEGVVSGCVVDENGKNGIRVHANSSVVGNHARRNDATGATGKAGIWVTGNYNRVQGNTVTGNNNGIVVDISWNTVVRNLVGGNLSSNFVSSPTDPTILMGVFTIGDTPEQLQAWDNIEQP
jgi:parallel beta-helix repeat protein